MGRNSILIVDDSPSIRETLGFLLKKEGFEVHTASNGVEGLKAVRRLRPAAVLVDAMMPKMDGFELCRRIRADLQISGTTIIMLTAMAQQVDEVNAREAGADEFLTKPPDLKRMLEILGNVCGE